MCNKHLMLGQTAVIYTHAYTQSHTFNTFTQAQYSVDTHEKHCDTLTAAMKAQKKRLLGGPTTGCCANQVACIEEKQRVRQTDLCMRVRVCADSWCVCS